MFIPPAFITCLSLFAICTHFLAEFLPFVSHICSSLIFLLAFRAPFISLLHLINTFSCCSHLMPQLIDCRGHKMLPLALAVNLLPCLLAPNAYKDSDIAK